jgi:signal transduction histidine kinase
MATALPKRCRVALQACDGRHSVLLADATLVELLRRVALSGDAAIGASIVGLAQADPSLGAWLVDRVTGGARAVLPRRDSESSQAAEAFGGPASGDATSNGSPPRPAIRWQGIGRALQAVAPAELLAGLTQDWIEVGLTTAAAADWAERQRRSRILARRTAELLSEQRPDAAEDAFWWSLCVTAPFGCCSDDGGGWRVDALGWESWLLRSEHPLFDCHRALCRAAAEAAMPSQGTEASQPIRAPDKPSAWASLRALVPELLRMAARCRQLEEHFQQALEHEKLLAMKELAYGASHEINNPLANISSRAQLLLRDETDPERRRSLATINSQAFRAHEMIADMMLFAKPPALQPDTIRLREFLENLLEQLAAELPAGVQLTRQLPDAEWQLRADPVQLNVALRAIWTNALEAMGEPGQGGPGGKLRLVARVVEGGAADGWRPWAEIEVADNGPGIRPEVRRHLFDPFFSGREAGRGLGFGLSKAWRIVTLHEGQIVVSSQPGEGASFTVRLPLTTPTNA